MLLSWSEATKMVKCFLKQLRGRIVYFKIGKGTPIGRRTAGIHLSWSFPMIFLPIYFKILLTFFVTNMQKSTFILNFLILFEIKIISVLTFWDYGQQLQMDKAKKEFQFILYTDVNWAGHGRAEVNGKVCQRKW